MSQVGSDEVRQLPVPALVYLVNEWGDVPRRAAGESRDAYPDEASLTELCAETIDRAAVGDLTTLVGAANELYALFGTRSPREFAAHLDHLVRVATMTPRIFVRGTEARQGWQVVHHEHELLASGVLSILAHVHRHPDPRRLGTCVGDSCADVYVDLSPAGRRRFCSLTCQTRHRTRAHRSRRADAEHGRR